jgi:hypothetical protein
VLTPEEEKKAIERLLVNLRRSTGDGDLDRMKDAIIKRKLAEVLRQQP